MKLAQDKYEKLTQDNYVNLAEEVIKNLKENAERKKETVVTTSKIRNLLSMTAAIYNDVINSKEKTLSDEIKGRIQYLKVRFVYESGREKSVKKLVDCGNILKHLEEIGDSKAQYILFSRYMEALVAYRKFYIEKDE